MAECNPVMTLPTMEEIREQFRAWFNGERENLADECISRDIPAIKYVHNRYRRTALTLMIWDIKHDIGKYTFDDLFNLTVECEGKHHAEVKEICEKYINREMVTNAVSKEA